MIKPWRQEAGLTLIETMISLMIFSVGMLGLSGLTTVVIHGNSLSQKITMATILAQDKLEAVQGAPYHTVLSEEEIVITENDRQYKRVMDVAHDIPMQNMKTVSITVYWTQKDSTHRHVSLKTIVRDDRE